MNRYKNKIEEAFPHNLNQSKTDISIIIITLIGGEN
jgi:hypothetical protein